MAYSLGKECFPYFCNLFLYDYLFDYSGDKVPLSENHYKIWNDIQEKMLHKNNTKTVYVMPRGYGKTSTICLPLALWTALYCIHPFVVIQSAVEERANNFIASLKMMIEDNPFIKSCFGEIINKGLKYNSSEIEFDLIPQRSKIQSVSATSSVRGITYNNFRVGLLLVDDGQDEKQITTEKARADFINNFNSGIMKTLQTQNNHTFAFGTVQKVGDLYDSLLNSPVWTAHIEKCIPVDDVDELFNGNKHWRKVKDILKDKVNNPNAPFEAENYYLQHQSDMDFPVIWEKYQCYDLFLEWLADSVAFKREYQGNIRSLGEKRIKSISKLSPEMLESLDYEKTILSVDPAAVNSAKNDYYAFCVMSENENKVKFARKTIIDKMDYDEYIDRVIQLLVEYPDIDALSVEKNTYMGADVAKIKERISLHPELKNRALPIFNKMRTQNKDARIESIIPDINFGRIIFNSEDDEAIEQIEEFSGCAFTVHDDAIDCVTNCIEFLPQIEKTGGGDYYFVPFSKIGL